MEWTVTVFKLIQFLQILFSIAALNNTAIILARAVNSKNSVSIFFD